MPSAASVVLAHLLTYISILLIVQRKPSRLYQGQWSNDSNDLMRLWGLISMAGTYVYIYTQDTDIV